MWNAHYDIFGRIDKLSKNSIENPIRMQGQYEDEETGLYYNRFRYYDPVISAYVSQDPLGLGAGENVYSYVKNSFGWIDPCKKSAAENLPELKGKSVSHVEKTLKKNGFQHVNPQNQKNQRWVHSDGSEVQVHKYGNKNPTLYKSGNNAHIHKSIGKYGDVNALELDEFRNVLNSQCCTETHKGIKILKILS